MAAPLFVIVTGPPASGKSTLAPPLAQALGLPLVAKDTIKDALMDVLSVPDVAASRRLGAAAVRAMFSVAAALPVGAVIESNLYRSRAADDVNELPGRVIEVFCRCPREVATARYRARAGTRHAGHFDTQRTADELWDDVSDPVAGGWPVIEIATHEPVDLGQVVARVREERPDGEPSKRPAREI